MGTKSLDSFHSHKTLDVGGKTYHYCSLPDAAQNGLGPIDKLPYSLKVLLENLLRHENGTTVTEGDVKAVGKWLENRSSKHEIAYHPARSYARFHGSTSCCGSSRDAPSDDKTRWRSKKDQPAISS